MKQKARKVPHVPGEPKRKSLSRSDRLAGDTIASLLRGTPVNGREPTDYGRWARMVEALRQSHEEGGEEAVQVSWRVLTRVEPELEELVRTRNEPPLAGTDEEIRRILKPGCSGNLPTLPSVDGAEELADLAEFVDHVMAVRGLEQRTRRLAVCHAVRELLLTQGRVLMDSSTGASRGLLYIIGDQDGVWPLSDDALPMKAMLARSGINYCERLAKWVVADLTVHYDAAVKVELNRYWARRDGKLYISSGPTEMVRASLESGRVNLEVLPNGADDVYFTSGGVLPPWEPNDATTDPLTVTAFKPALVAPREVETYTPEVQLRLLSAWLAALVAGIRPLPILAAIGNRGGGKTTLVKGVTRAVARGMPTSVSHDPRDMWTLAANQPVLGLDNVDSQPSSWFPDFLAATATGVAYERRKLYTDAETHRTSPDAAILISTRTGGFARADVADRTLPIFTGVFEDSDRVGDAELMDEVLENRDAILTYLAHHAAELLAGLEEAPILPCRFVDFARIVWAYSPDTAVADLRALRRAQSLTVGDSDSLIRAVLECETVLLGSSSRWEGTPKQLAHALKGYDADIPAMSGRDVARRLREGADTLRLLGIHLDERRSGNNTIFTLARKG